MCFLFCLFENKKRPRQQNRLRTAFKARLIAGAPLPKLRSKPSVPDLTLIVRGCTAVKRTKRRSLLSSHPRDMDAASPRNSLCNSRIDSAKTNSSRRPLLLDSLTLPLRVACQVDFNSAAEGTFRVREMALPPSIFTAWQCCGPCPCRHSR